MGTVSRDEPCHGPTMFGDLDLVTRGHVVEQGQDFGFGFGRGYFSDHMVIIVVRRECLAPPAVPAGERRTRGRGGPFRRRPARLLRSAVSPLRCPWSDQPPRRTVGALSRGSSSRPRTRCPRDRRSTTP